MKTYIRSYAAKSTAMEACRLINKSYEEAGNRRDLMAVVEGPEDNYCVADLRTAIDLGLGYTII